MNKYLQIVWFSVTGIARLSFGFVSRQWADGLNRGRFALTVLWSVISLVLFAIGLSFCKSSS